MPKRGTKNSSINSSVRQQTQVIKEQTASNNEGLSKILAEQSKMADTFVAMKDILVKLNSLHAGELKQKVRLRDLGEQEIKHLQRKNDLSQAEAKAIANLAQSMKSFPSLMDRLRDKGEKITNMFKNPMGSIRTGLLKATNVFGINDRRLEREKFIAGQKALGSNKTFAEHAKDFEGAQHAKQGISKNEAKIEEMKKLTGMTEKQLAKTESGKKLLDTRKTLTDEYAKHDVRAQGIRGEAREEARTQAVQERRGTPSQQFQDSGKQEEQENEDAKLMGEQTDLLKKIEQNTRGDSPALRAKGATGKGDGEGKGGLLTGLLGGVGNAVKHMKDFGIGLVAVAAGLWVASKALKGFADLEWGAIGKGMVTLAGFVLMAKALKGGTGDMIKAAVGIVAISGALWVASKALGAFADLDWESILKAGVVLLGIGVAGNILGKMMGTMIMASVGIAAMGASLWVIGEALQTFNDATWESMLKAAVSITALGLASLLLAPAAPLMIAAGAGLAAMGAGLWVLGEAFQAIGKGFEDMTNGIERIGKVNGDNLWNVAKGLGAVSAAMVAFAASNVLTGISNLATKLLSIGQDSPIEQLEKISKLGVGIMKAGTGMERLAKGMKAFSEMDGMMLEHNMSALNKFPWEKATNFINAGGTMSVSSAQVYNGSKGNEDAKAQVAAYRASSAAVTIAPSTNVQNTQVQQMRPAIRNGGYSGGLMGAYTGNKYQGYFR